MIRRVVEEGFGALKKAPRLVASKDVAIPFSAKLEDYVVMQPADIVNAAAEMMG